MEDTIDRMIGVASSSSQGQDQTNKQIFIPCSTFQGAKPGYYFGTIANIGLGYHVDPYFSDTTTHASIPAAKVAKLRPKTGQELLAEAEKQQTKGIKIISLTSRGIQSATQSLEMSIQENQNLRQKYTKQPEKFMESELKLNDEISSWKDLAASSNCECYPYLIEYGSIQYLLHLLQTHENNDVGMAIISVFVEWMDVELISSAENPLLVQKHLAMIAQEFVKEDGFPIIVKNLAKLSIEQSEDVKGMDDTLSLIESLMDLDSMIDIFSSYTEDGNKMDYSNKSLVHILLSQTKFVSWLFHQIQSIKSFQSLKLHCGELLASILQHEDASPFTNQLQSMPAYDMGNEHNDADKDESKPPASKKPKTDATLKNPSTIDGMEILLVTISQYRKKQPSSEEECEYLENCFNSLSASMLHYPNVQSFLDLQGPELMFRCIREKVHSGAGSLRVLYFCVSASGSSAVRKKACEYMIEIGGLKVFFPLFMGRKANMPKPAPCSDAGKIELIQKAKIARQNQDESLKISKRAKRALQAKKDWMKQIESHAIQIMYNLTRYISSDSPNDAKDRLVVKFLEKDCEKCDRLIELLLKYDERMRLAELRYYRSDAAEEAEEQGLDLDLAGLNEKLKGGGDLFHCLGAISAFVCVGSKRCHEHLLEQLKVKSSGISCK